MKNVFVILVSILLLFSCETPFEYEPTPPSEFYDLGEWVSSSTDQQDTFTSGYNLVIYNNSGQKYLIPFNSKQHAQEYINNLQSYRYSRYILYFGTTRITSGYI